VPESALPSCVAEAVEATCVCEAGFDPNKAPNNLLADRPGNAAFDYQGLEGQQQSDIE
jgi:hypothetical protein